MEHRAPYSPLPADHPLVVNRSPVCPGCNQPFVASDVVTLIPIGPGADPDARIRARHGRPYQSVAVVAHWSCVTGEE